jgi:hypothetical protein
VLSGRDYELRSIGDGAGREMQDVECNSLFRRARTRVRGSSRAGCGGGEIEGGFGKALHEIAKSWG